MSLIDKAALAAVAAASKDEVVRPVSDQPTLFDPGPVAPTAPPPVTTPEAWWQEFVRHRLAHREGGNGYSPDAERQARRRFARRHGLGRAWLARYQLGTGTEGAEEGTT